VRLDRVTLRLDFFISPHHIPFIVANERGYYAEEGLEVILLEGRGSLSSLQIIAAGADTFGFVAGSTYAIGRAQDMPVQMVADYIQNNPGMLIFYCDEGIDSPEDLRGKTLAETPGATPGVDMLPALLSKYGMTRDDLTVVNLEPAARLPALIEGRVDMLSGFGFSTLGDVRLRAQEAGKGEICFLKFTDYDITLLGHGIVVNNETIERRPEIIERFLRATNKGWEDVVADDAAAAQVASAAYPDTRAAFLEAGAAELESTLHTAATQGKPLGWMATEDWQQTIDILTEFTEFDGDQDGAAYFTNEFLE
jgi:NitT/TauT family transport system substrate-binding protein